MNSSSYLFRRCLLILPTLIGIVIMVFVVLLLIPGNPAEFIQGEMANPEITKALITKWGLDQPPAVRLVKWFSSLSRFDLGTSLVTGRPVSEMLVPRLEYSAYLGTFAIVAGLSLGIPIGIVSATRPNSVVDYGSTVGVLLGLSLPVFIVGLLLQFIFGLKLHLVPISGAPNSIFDIHTPKYALLPALSEGALQAAVVARVCRTFLLDILHADYIRTAQSKGASEIRVIRKHALPNVAIPLVTLIGVNIKTAISGLLVVEIVFGWPGIGRLFYDAVEQRDYPVIQAVALVIALGVAAINLLVDLIYVAVDPRLRSSTGK